MANIDDPVTDEDRARWRDQFKPKPVWLPQVHYHKASKRYVEGIMPDDGCWVCDNQWPLVLDAMKRGDPVPPILCVSFTEEALEKQKRRKEMFGEPVFYDGWSDKPMPVLPPGDVVPDVSAPKRDDFARWKKQFSPMMERIRRMNAVKEEARWKDDVQDEELIPVGETQYGLFGGSEVIPFKKSRRKKR